MKKLIIFLILLNICFFILAFAVNLHFPFDEWRKGPPVHHISVYSSGNASKVFWVSTAGLLNLYIFLIFLFNRTIRRKNRIFASKGLCLIAAGAAIFAGSLFTVEYAVRLYVKNSPGYSQFRPHPLLFWYNRPNFNKASITINSSGFRYKEDIPVSKPQGERRIFVLGDSSAFGNGVRGEEVFSAQLEKKLNNEYGGRKFRVINAACPGHTTYQGLILLKHELLKFDPDMLIVTYNNDPGLEYSEEKRRSIDNPFIKGLNVILYHSDYYLLFQRVVTDFKLSLLAKFKVRSVPSLVRRVSLEDYKNNIQEFMRISKGRNIRVLFVKMPVNPQAFRDFPFLKELFYDEEYRNALVDICRNEGYALADVDSSWPVKNGRGLFEMVEYDGKTSEAHFHPSPKGHMKIAEQLYAWIAGTQLSSDKIYKIRIGCSSLTPVHCMFGEVFKRTDILRKHNLEGEVIFFLHGGDQGDASKSGKIDVTFSCEVPAVFHLANTPSLRIVGAPGSLGRIALIVPAGSGIFSPQDLKDKVILIHEGSSAAMTVRKWLQAAGLNPDQDVKLAYSDKEGVLDKLNRKEADAVVSWDPWLEELLQKQDLRVIKERLFRSVVVVSDDYILKSPEAVIRYEAALKDAFLWASDNKEAVTGWISERSGIKQPVVEKVMMLNENWSLPGPGKEKISLNLKQEDLDILQECNDYVVKTGQMPADFDIKKKINYGIFNK